MLNLKKLVLDRSRSVPVEFLGMWSEVTFNSAGVGKLTLEATDIKPVSFGLIVPLATDGTEMFGDALGAELAWEVKGNKLTIAPETWAEYKLIEGAGRTALVSIPRKYQGRRMSSLLPADIRKMTASSADVMSMINDRDPGMVDRISALMGDKVKTGTLTDARIATEIEAALNVELTMKHPDLLLEIERVQMAQSAVQLAVMLDADPEFFVTLQMDIAGGETMIRELIAEIEPAQVLVPLQAVVEAVEESEAVEVTAAVSALDDALGEEIEEDDDYEDALDDEDDGFDGEEAVAAVVDGPSSVEPSDDEDDDFEDDEDDEGEDV